MIEKINFICVFKFETESLAKNIHRALRPDNLTSDPVTINSIINNTNLLYTIKNNKRIESVLATVTDIITAAELSETIIKIEKTSKSG
ncbi:MAG: KEOPS complex subunit Pcc1 [Candidatus Hodarchaeales archaeon]